MKKILILFGHPAIRRSKMNAALKLAAESINGITVHDLYASYPDFLIDVSYEQHLCEYHDILIFQHPFYWYATPSIIKEWFDLVLEHNWAYGGDGSALRGKVTFQTLTAGGDLTHYHAKGLNRFTIKELTTPFCATAHLCGMVWLPPFAVLGIHQGLSNRIINSHTSDYKRTLMALRDNRLDIERAKVLDRLNQNLDTIIQKE